MKCQKCNTEIDGDPHFDFENKGICHECIEEYMISYFNFFTFSFFSFLYKLQDRHKDTFFKLTKTLLPYYFKRHTSVSPSQRAEILKKFGYMCKHCGAKKQLEIDHIIPYSKGGLDIIDNYQVLCKTCNLKKGVKIEGDYGLV